MRIQLLSFLLFLNFASFSQKDIQEGYIVRNNTDTVKGYIKLSTEEQYVSGITFSTTTDKFEKISYSEMSSFGFRHNGQDVVYRVVKYKNPLEEGISKTHFAKLLLDGSGKLYSFMQKDVKYFAVANNDTTYFLYNDIRGGNRGPD